jgi:Flp pilus assembly protein TadG
MPAVLRTVLPRIRRDERGNGDVAAMIVVVPLALALVLVFVLFGRQGVAAEEVTHAAAVAARAASMERDAGAAQSAAAAAASVTLAEAGRSCAGGPSVAVSASSWEAGGVVSVTVTCQVSGIASIGASARSIFGRARATIDAYRSYGAP